MCVCDPRKRTPFCGKPGCEWLPKPQPKVALPLHIDQALTRLYLHIPLDADLPDTTEIMTPSSELYKVKQLVLNWHRQDSRETALAALRAQIKLIEATRTEDKDAQ